MKKIIAPPECASSANKTTTEDLVNPMPFNSQGGLISTFFFFHLQGLKEPSLPTDPGRWRINDEQMLLRRWNGLRISNYVCLMTDGIVRPIDRSGRARFAHGNSCSKPFS